MYERLRFSFLAIARLAVWAALVGVAGAGLTVRVAAELVCEPTQFVTTTSYWSPLLLSDGFEMVRVALFSPGMPTPLRCHW